MFVFRIDDLMCGLILDNKTMAREYLSGSLRSTDSGGKHPNHTFQEVGYMSQENKEIYEKY